MATPDLVFCSQVSAGQAEPLYGTATRADVWIMVEYGGRWGAKAFAESDLPTAVKEHLAAAVEATPHTRLQFIKQPQHTGDGPVHVFVARASLGEPTLYAFTFDTLHDLTSVDFAAVAAGDAAYDAHLRSEPLFMVCTNGLRDRCCAKFGLPVYEALQAAAGDAAWQTTHIGGHRFAPNMLFMPHALSYGHVAPEQIGTLVQAYREGEVVLSNLRGRTIYEKPEQAALYFLRSTTGERSADAYERVSQAEAGDGIWEVQVGFAGEDRTATVRLREVRADAEVYKTCGAEALTTPTTFELISID